MLMSLVLCLLCCWSSLRMYGWIAVQLLSSLCRLALRCTRSPHHDARRISLPGHCIRERERESSSRRGVATQMLGFRFRAWVANGEPHHLTPYYALHQIFTCHECQ